MAKVLTPEVLIVGAGITGVPLAIGLKSRGIDVMLVERSAQVRRVFKAEYMQPGPIKILKDLGLESAITGNKFSNITELHFRDLGENNKDIIAEIRMRYPRYSHAVTFTHDELVKNLRKIGLRELGENFWLGANLQPINQNDPSFFDKPIFELRKTGEEKDKVIVKPKWIVGCDGRHSSVRQWIRGAKVPRNTRVVFGANPELIIGAEIAKPAPIRYCYQVIRTFGEGTLFAFNLPGVGQRLYYSTLDTPGEGKTHWQNGIKKILDQANPYVNLGELDDEAPIVGCPAFQTWLGPASRGRFLLVGDAVAITTPYGGQGISVGMEHVEHLVNNFEWRAKSALITGLTRREYTLTAENIHSRLDLINWSLYFLFFARNPFSKLTTQHVINSWHTHPEIPQKVMNFFGSLSREKPSLPEVFDIWGLQKGRRTKLLSLLKPALTKNFARIDTNL